MNVTDRIAEDHFSLIAGQDLSDDDNDMRLAFSQTFTIADESFSKTANISPISRILQECDDDTMHKTDDTPEIWQVKKGKIIRTTSQFIKRG
jgi:hypothetical protein